jgi:hypothetical protein
MLIGGLATTDKKNDRNNNKIIEKNAFHKKPPENIFFKLEYINEND